MENRPNVIFVLTDDQGPWAAGCCGNDEVRTPYLDQLASEGTRFPEFLLHKSCLFTSTCESHDRTYPVGTRCTRLDPRWKHAARSRPIP